MNKDIWALSW